MKEKLQKKQIKLTFVNACAVSACIHTSASFHVENAVKDFQTVEVEDAEPEYQEQPEEEYVVAGQASDQDLTNFDTQQGKPRCI